MPESYFDIIRKIIEPVIGLGIRLSPLYLVTMVVIAFIIYLHRNPSKPFFSWVFPKSIYFHKSHLTDIKLFILGRILAGFGLIGFVSIASLTAAWAMGLIGGEGPPEAVRHPILITILVVITSDFGVYWVHRFHHKWAVIWPFHSVHHSAEVLTPITVYRKHPIYDLFSRFFQSILIGLLQGLMLGLFVGKIEIAAILGTNIAYVAFHFLGSNLRHSHVWLSYGNFLEHIFISPAQHQIHHSIEPKHKDKNFGEILALWDWIFGSLYIPKTREKLTFGLPDDKGLVQPQPHSSLSKALWVPFIDSWAALRGKK